LAEVTVVGDRSFGAADRAHLATAKRLAAIAGTDLLGVRFFDGKRGPHFLDANPIPALKDRELIQAVYDYLSA
jgi:hypothetical protein